LSFEALSTGELIIGKAPIDHLSLGTDSLAFPVPMAPLGIQLIAVLSQLAVPADLGRGRLAIQ
jgi:hypothetical protein